MGMTIEFASNGTVGQGYLATPAGGQGPGVIVIQEWWGLVPHIEDVCERFAAEGYVALAPDFYHGARTSEPDEAGKLMMAIDLDKATQDFSGAVDALLDRSTGTTVGVVGFCMGGGLALVLATKRPDAIAAVVPFYGVTGWLDPPDWHLLRAAVSGHYAENDYSASPSSVAQLEADLRAAGNHDVTMYIYPNTEHAFFNDSRPEVYDAEASRLAFSRTLAFLRSKLA